MGLTHWFRPLSRTLAVFLVLMVVLGGALSWFGWQWLKQDRALEGQRLKERLELAADHMTARLQQSLLDLEGYLISVPDPGAPGFPAGVLVMRASKGALDVYPSGRLLFSPMVLDEKEPPAVIFEAGEALEFQNEDPARAAEVFRGLAHSPDPGVRAGALLRLGRNLRKAGHPEEALPIYDELARLGRTSVFGFPAELMARGARGTVLEAAGRKDDLRQEAALLRAALWTGRWRLPRSVWEYYQNEALRWLGAGALTESEMEALALAGAVESLCGQWQAEPESKGRRILKSEGRPVLISWSGASERLAAVLAGPVFLEAGWGAALRSPRVRGALIDGDGQVLMGDFDKAGLQAIRTTPVAGLPVTLHVTSADPRADEAGISGRRRMLISVFAVLALVFLAGSYFIVVAIARGRAVSRQQSEFVSAVSHEFRTPLTSLRQLSEMLAKGRVPTEDLRQKSYDILSRESERLQRLVESLLDIGRIEARSFQYQFENVDPGRWLAGLVAEFQDQVSAQGSHVELDTGGDYPAIRADREALGLAVRNLLENAVKYSPDCRTVWVEMARKRARLAIRVRDKGLGIPVSERKEIFKRFVRGSGSKAAQIQGTGIGLALARRIVEAHDGEIRLESEPGRGSTFTIWLPLEERK